MTASEAAAIRHHYDVGNDFYRLWLDRSLTYSCAMPRNPGDTLEIAQERKLQYHLDAIDAHTACSVLDIGCGWGSILRRLAETHHVPYSVGLTLSDEQVEFVTGQRYPGVQVRIESWRDHRPDGLYDGIISIGAFEHFATPDQSRADKIQIYREFFARCRDWLTESGVFSLQTIAYANMAPEDASEFIQREIFPRAELPTLAEIAAAADRVFEIRSLRNDRPDYAWTCEQWARRLHACRDQAANLVGAATVARYERYLRLSALGFRMGKLCLLRLVLRPYPRVFGGAR